ncbi:tyrosine decarboxylase [Exophiala viscosa]|uniref:Tyrosine decarboxylase n=1 Tax=Exophiala viscosa TaxID=2486360 RepID=A0AAN6DK98_9EURO|nr:tyrosine decarboxylase [Exophiala viscosa]KAI1628429.1 tyrosine decarboxylase [Exophiala viscosa]
MDQKTSLEDIVAQLQNLLSTSNLRKTHAQAGDTIGSQPILPVGTPNLAELQSHVDLSSTILSDNATDLSALAEHLSSKVLPYLNLGSLSPNYYGFVIGGATPAALLGDFLASIYDQNVHVHLPAETVATTLEIATLNLLVQLYRLPAPEWTIGGSGPGGGTFTTGATASNVLGLALGREYVLREAVQRAGLGSEWSCGASGVAESMIQAGVQTIQVLSTLPHSSLAKAASIVGIGRKNFISIATDNHPLQIDMARLDIEARRPGVLNILAISAGEVNTGRFATASLSTMKQLREICDKYKIWIHVDGAFGLFGRILPTSDQEFSEIVRGVEGLELADSITGDCHKLLNVPYDSGVFFTRHKTLSENVFGNGNAAYLTSALGDGDAIQSPLNIGIENSRRFRALPAYCTLIAYGREGYVDMLKRQIGLARRVTMWLLDNDKFEVLPVGGTDQEILAKTYMVVLFRVKDPVRNTGFVKRVNATGNIYLSGTVWDGKPAARIAVSNWQVDVQRDGDLIEDVLEEAAG